MKNIILIIALFVSLVWSQDIFAKTKHKKQPVVGQRYSTGQPHPAVYKSAHNNKYKKRAVSSTKSKKKKSKAHSKSSAQGKKKKKKPRY